MILGCTQVFLVSTWEVDFKGSSGDVSPDVSHMLMNDSVAFVEKTGENQQLVFWKAKSMVNLYGWLPF